MRLPDWKQQLRAEIAAAGDRAFRYGSHDCLQFVGRCVKAQTGVDYVQRFGRYRSLRGSLRILRTYDYDIGRLLTSVLGPPIAPNLVAYGDVVEADLEGGLTAGICEGFQCAFAGGRGVLRYGRETVRRGWKVT